MEASNMKTNFQSAKKRIQKADTIEKLQSLDESFTRIYNAGQLTATEFNKLDSLLLSKIIKLENA